MFIGMIIIMVGIYIVLFLSILIIDNRLSSDSKNKQDKIPTKPKLEVQSQPLVKPQPKKQTNNVYIRYIKALFRTIPTTIKEKAEEMEKKLDKKK